MCGLVEVLLYVHRIRRFIRTGAQEVHLDFHRTPELCSCGLVVVVCFTALMPMTMDKTRQTQSCFTASVSAVAVLLDPVPQAVEGQPAHQNPR